ncbi:hypothetical protein K3495_g7681 [Podosphaera aphanis]|nr:hypothetical protein K3495_g7681 [Podosphaera aphanis]
MLHEILLSLSGHPSPLLTDDYASPSSLFSPPEKALLASIAHISELHCKLLAQTSTITATHPSSICQAVATAIRSNYLSKFQNKVLKLEENILRKNADYVGAHNIVSLTRIVSEFSGWTRKMEWFLEVVDFIVRGRTAENRRCSGAMVIDNLCDAMQTGYLDIEEAALNLVTVAETAWLRQISAWVLYGKLPSYGREDFFVQTVSSDEPIYEGKMELLPAFVTVQTANSLLFIGRSLNHIRVKRISTAKASELNLVSAQLQQLSSLNFPISSQNFSRVISSIRLSLSQINLRQLLPVVKILRILLLLRQLFLLGRGEFAIALVNEADERMRSRWRQTKGKSYENRDEIPNIVIKEGETFAVLARTWAALSALQGQHEENQEEDDILELARDIVQLTIAKPALDHHSRSPSGELSSLISSTPFKNLLLSIPAILTMQIPSPLDLFLSPSDVQIYSSINAYLLSIRRAHLRLTDLWKVTALRRDYSAPLRPSYTSSKTSQYKFRKRRERTAERFSAMRTVWATSSAAVFFLAETEAYFQGEVVQGTWLGFKNWINGESKSQSTTRPSSRTTEAKDAEEILLHADVELTYTSQIHDPQSLADAHRSYLSALASRLLLMLPTFTQPLYHLLQQIDHLVALVHRIHSIWQCLDLEIDEGVVDPFSDFHREEKDIKEQLSIVATKVKIAIEKLINSLRDIDQDKDGWDSGFAEFVLIDKGQYVPAKVGRVDRLLMKLDFGGWFDNRRMDRDDPLSKSDNE